MRYEPFHLHPDSPARYAIHTQGQVEPRWLEVLSGVWQINPEQMAIPDITILIGRVLDQAALLGDLQQLYGLGLALLRVECLGPAEAVDGGRHPAPARA